MRAAPAVGDGEVAVRTQDPEHGRPALPAHLSDEPGAGDTERLSVCGTVVVEVIELQERRLGLAAAGAAPAVVREGFKPDACVSVSVVRPRLVGLRAVSS